jgi:hypothetical protein
MWQEGIKPVVETTAVAVGFGKRCEWHGVDVSTILSKDRYQPGGCAESCAKSGRESWSVMPEPAITTACLHDSGER